MDVFTPNTPLNKPCPPVILVILPYRLFLAQIPLKSLGSGRSYIQQLLFLGSLMQSKVKVAQSCPSLRPHELYCPWNFPGQNTGAGRLSLLQGIFPTQGLNPGLPHCRQILYQLSHKESTRILESVAYPFFSRSSWPRNQTVVSCIAGRFFTNRAVRYSHFMQRWA